MSKKVGILTDTHFGVYKGSSLFLDSAMRFFREFVIPEMRSRGVDTLIHAGDMFDNRSSIDIKVLNEVFRLFRDDLEDFQIYCIVGNHDTVYKNSIEVNSVETLRGFLNVHVVSSPVMVGDIALVPWVVNKDNFWLFMRDNKPKVTVGHFEITGGKTNSSGYDSNPDHLNPNDFDGFTKMVISGHYHHRSVMNLPNCDIHYIGNCYHLNRGDACSDRGMVFLDVDKMQLEYVNDVNVAMRYCKLRFPDKYNKEEISGNIVDIHVDIDSEDYNEKDFGNYVSGVESCSPAVPPYVRIERTGTVTVESVDMSGAGSVIDILNEYVRCIKLDDETRKKVTEKIKNLQIAVESKNAEN